MKENKGSNLQILQKMFVIKCLACNLENWIDFLEKTTYGNHNLTTEPGELQNRDEEWERALRKSIQKNL